MKRVGVIDDDGCCGINATPEGQTNIGIEEWSVARATAAALGSTSTSHKHPPTDRGRHRILPFCHAMRMLTFFMSLENDRHPKREIGIVPS